MTEENGTRANLGAVAAALDGLRDLTKQGFSDTQRQLDELKPLGPQISSLTERTLLNEQRTAALERRADKADEDKKTNRRTYWPTAITALIGLMTLILLLLQVVHG